MKATTTQTRIEAAANPNLSRRDFLKGTVAAGAVVGGSLGAFYFGYEKALGRPVRVGIIGTGDEGSVLIGAVNPEFIEVRAIADIRPYSIWRAFHGDHYSEAAAAARPGLLAKYGWKSEDEGRRHVKVYGPYEELLAAAKEDGLEGVIIALPLHLHAPAAIAAMKAGLHVLTEKLMAHSVRECKDIARVAARTGLLLAVGHQRHYNILYANAVETIRSGLLGQVHYIRAQWHRGNLPGKDSWQQPLPPEVKPDDPLASELPRLRKAYQAEIAAAYGSALQSAQRRLAQVEAQWADKVVEAERYGYQSKQILDAAGKVVYHCPPIEELIRWRLWDRTSGGLMAELGSHQLDAAGIFIAAAHGGKKQLPLSVAAFANRPLFPPDRDVEDHVYCLLEYPAPGYDPNDPFTAQKKIGVQYASINGNGFGGYGEMVFGTEGTLALLREQELWLVKGQAAPSSMRVATAQSSAPTLDTQASGMQMSASAAGGTGGPVSRGYAEELEHWAWCIRNPAPENQPRCGPKTALADAIVALSANIAARKGMRIEFQPAWFEIESDETPEGIPPSVSSES